MKNYYYTFEECFKNMLENYEEEDSVYTSREDIDNFPLCMSKSYYGNQRIETSSGLQVRILGYRKDLKSKFPLIALVNKNGEEILIEYDKFGNRKLSVEGIVAGHDDEYKLIYHSFHFEPGDYVANDSFIGIIEEPTLRRYKFMKYFYDGKEYYNWFSDAPTRSCTEEEIKIINNCFDNSKYINALMKKYGH